MMIEIALLQRMSIFLGHPVYSLSVLLSTLILATGIGSFLCDKFPLQTRSRLLLWAAATGGYSIALSLLMGPVLIALDGAELPSRIIFCIAVIAPLGMLLGFGFPSGLRLISLVDAKPTPWFWGINGAAGVLASIVALVLSLAFGISVTLSVGGLCYFLLIPSALFLTRAMTSARVKKTSPVRISSGRAAKLPARRSR
jgi:hypothetical protein